MTVLSLNHSLTVLRLHHPLTMTYSLMLEFPSYFHCFFYNIIFQGTNSKNIAFTFKLKFTYPQCFLNVPLQIYQYRYSLQCLLPKESSTMNVQPQ